MPLQGLKIGSCGKDSSVATPSKLLNNRSHPKAGANNLHTKAAVGQ